MRLWERLVRKVLRYPPHSPTRQLYHLCPSDGINLKNCNCKGWHELV